MCFGRHIPQFESSVNSYGGKTTLTFPVAVSWFESSVNSYGGKTKQRGDYIA